MKWTSALIKLKLVAGDSTDFSILLNTTKINHKLLNGIKFSVRWPLVYMRQFIESVGGEGLILDIYGGIIIG